MVPKWILRWPGGGLLPLLIAGATGSFGHGTLSYSPSVSYDIVQRYPHSKDCFTEGLSLNGSDAEVFESCGLTGKSFVKRYELRSGNIKQTVPLERRYFGEGTVLFGSSLLVLTYQHREMLELDSKTFQTLRSHPFPYGEGWGLTTDGCDLLATTGSEYIFRLRRDLTGQFELVNKVKVTHHGRSLRMLNEVEYITPKLWVNEWYSNRVWRVDPLTGAAELHVDIGKLYNWGHSSATPNGIAYSPTLGEDLMLVTGKLWPEMFLLRLKVEDLCGGAAAKVSCPSAPPSACWHGSTAAPLAKATAAPSVAPSAVPSAAPSAAPVAVATPAPAPAAVESGAVGLAVAAPQVSMPRGIAVFSSFLGS